MQEHSRQLRHFRFPWFATAPPSQYFNTDEGTCGTLKRSGIDVDVLSGAEEAHLILSLRPVLTNVRDGILIDIGAGGVRRSWSFVAVR